MLKNIHYWLAGSLFLAFFACRSESQPSGGSIDFGIYETMDAGELSIQVRQHLQLKQVDIVAEPRDAIVGYTLLQDQVFRDSVNYDVHVDGIRFALTAFPFASREGARAVVALKLPAIIGLDDVREAVPLADRVEIRFNMQGARKWAEMTDQNTGRQVAFMFEGKIYSLPLVAAPIRSGVSLITGLDSDEAIRIAGTLNGEEVQ